MKLTKLQKEIIKTLLFFNLHKRPLNPKEVHQYANIKSQESHVFLALLDLCRKNKVIEKNQYFTLRKYQGLFKTFYQRLKIKQDLENKTRKFIWLIRLMPFVRAVMLANSLTMGLPNKNSDIDLVVLCKKNRLWTCRFFLTGILTMLGHKRAKNVKTAPGKLCLSYYLSLKESNLKPWRLKNDPLMDYWLATFRPLTGGKAIELFYSQNVWLGDFFPNLKIETTNQKVKPLSFGAFLLEKTLDLFGDRLENFLFKSQSAKIKAKNKPDTLIATQNICRLLKPDNYRFKFAKKFQKELKKFLK
ncbi:MAG: hypothetical protein PHW50_01945 [Patescibacteria group bacterium]|nr:hypothetical protein [Patescibacteria group bacterium]